MLLKADAKALEWRVKVYQAQDKVAMQEIEDNVDIHTENQKTFKLPDRLFAKIFVYRMIFADAFGDRGYAGPAYAYANDSDFRQASTSAKFWERVISDFFGKYTGIHAHSISLIQQAVSTGRIVLPTGRFYKFQLQQKYNGSFDWPRTQILNYPVQGLSADVMMLCRMLIKKRLLKLPEYGKRVFLINTVHDDVQLDVDNDPELVYNISILLEKCFEDIPTAFQQIFGKKFNVPLAGEVSFGKTLYGKDLVEFKKSTFENDYKKIIN